MFYFLFNFAFNSNICFTHENLVLNYQPLIILGLVGAILKDLTLNSKSAQSQAASAEAITSQAYLPPIYTHYRGAVSPDVTNS